MVINPRKYNKGGGGVQKPPPPALYHGGVWIGSYVWGLFFNRSVNRNGQK